MDGIFGAENIAVLVSIFEFFFALSAGGFLQAVVALFAQLLGGV